MQNSRVNQFTKWGGDTTQLLETKYHLERLGLEIDYNSEINIDLSDYELVHIFNISEPETGLKQSINVKKNNIPLVLSPIYWDLSYGLSYKDFYLYFHRYSVRMAAKVNKNIPRILLKLFFENYRRFDKMHSMLSIADIIVPNSYAELEILINKFKMPELRKKAIIVPNGTSIPNFDHYNAKIPPNNVLDLPEKYVLEVGRIEAWKGQLNLIKALSDFPEIPLVFIGNKNSFYAQECIKLGKKRGNTYFLDEVPHEDLYHFYSKAKVHALPSLSETTGLSTLEAASFGVNCVVSIHGPITEYFGFDAFVCDPQNVNSIKNAVLEAWRTPKSNKLKKRVLNNFNWEKTAEKTLIAYEHILSMNKSHR